MQAGESRTASPGSAAASAARTASEKSGITRKATPCAPSVSARSFAARPNKITLFARRFTGSDSGRYESPLPAPPSSRWGRTGASADRVASVLSGVVSIELSIQRIPAGPGTVSIRCGTPEKAATASSIAPIGAIPSVRATAASRFKRLCSPGSRRRSVGNSRLTPVREKAQTAPSAGAYQTSPGAIRSVSGGTGEKNRDPLRPFASPFRTGSKAGKTPTVSGARIRVFAARYSSIPTCQFR